MAFFREKVVAGKRKIRRLNAARFLRRVRKWCCVRASSSTLPRMRARALPIVRDNYRINKFTSWRNVYNISTSAKWYRDTVVYHRGSYSPRPVTHCRVRRLSVWLVSTALLYGANRASREIGAIEKSCVFIREPQPEVSSGGRSRGALRAGDGRTLGRDLGILGFWVVIITPEASWHTNVL